MASARRERKVVTVLFCDLVGFTSRAEAMDPEDVEAFLGPYHDRLRSELERYGGTVEKFIGDAVMALFGAPVAHEDDPERAVRAALAIRDWALESEEAQVRLAVTTGEALVRLDARPESGEGMASGDVVNTAARLQAAAPVNGILVDETTYRATRHVIEHVEAEPVDAKGKAEPISVWEPRTARTRFGVDVAHAARSELVGRDRELGILRDAFARAVHDRIPQLVTLVGVPGIGKSRLVYELSRIAQDDEKLITWRQGRCLAYGEGVTVWALGEILKAQAGILEQDAPADVEEKIRATVDALLDEKDARWVEQHLRALVGLAGDSELGGDRRDETFAAWRRFLEGLAELRPLVLVFEDLHWADDNLLDFVDELVDWVSDVPLLVVGTARPELLERRPGWGGGKLNATTLALAPLSDEQTARLIAALLERPVLAAESQQALLERAGGNPLYAEQFADLFLEQGSAVGLSLPETLQGIISARLDGLPGDEKTLLHDAAVVGKVFWTGGLHRQPGEAASALHALERKGFVRRQRRSSVEGESEFAFAHALVRDVAYGQIPRAERSEKHRRVAEWIESLGRPQDHAEMLAYHWGSALEQAAGRDGSDLVDKSRNALRDAGDRAFGLNAFASAASYYHEALTLWPEEVSGRPQLLFRRARALQIADDDRAGDILGEAAAALLAVGDVDAAGEAESMHAQFLWYRGQRDAAYAHLATAEKLVEGRPGSPGKARILGLAARFRMLAGDGEAALRLGEEALALAEGLALDELRAHALATIGASKELVLGTPGVEELERALEIALEAGSPVASTIVNNLAVAKFRKGKLADATELYHEAYRLAERFGDGSGLRWSRGNLLFASYFFGDWDEAERGASAFILECESSPHYQEGIAREIRAGIRMARGDVESALEDWRRAVEIGREAKDPQAIVPSLLSFAQGLTLLGRIEEARPLAEEALEIVGRQPRMAGVLGIIVGVADGLGIRERMLEILTADSAEVSPWREAALATTTEDFSRAAEIYDEMGAHALVAEVQLDAARALIESGRRKEGEVELQKALAFYRSVGATFFVQRGEELLAASA
jgi:class 3 adenylate cyclase/tetratricopeptide (TPR) repeat protein